MTTLDPAEQWRGVWRPVAMAMLIAIGLSAGSIHAQAGIKEATVAYQAGDFKTALKEFLPLAKAGDADAQNLVAGLIALGKGTGQDPDPIAAAEWYELAANQGHPHATTMLGWYYLRGLGVEQDAVKGYRLLSRAAAQGEPRAAEMKKGVEDKALSGLGDLVLTEAHQHSIDMATAYYRVGQSFAKGHGVPRLPKVAFEAFREAAARGHSAGQYQYALRLDRGDGVAANIPEAFQWFKKAADQGHADAQAMVGRALLEGRGIAPDRYRAMVMITLARAGGSEMAQKVLDTLVK